MNSLNEYYAEVRSDIAKDFGIEVAYAPRTKQYMTVRQYQILNNKYPAIWEEGAYRPTANPKAVVIAKRYNRIMSVLKKGAN
jgi:hypothetical protein